MKKALQFALVSLVLFCVSDRAWGQSTAQELPERYIEVVYENATVYAAKTDYEFKRTDGSTFGISFSHLEEAKDWNPTMPDNMLQEGKDVEGVPGPNPDLVGKSFLLIFGEVGDRIMEVRLKE